VGFGQVKDRLEGENLSFKSLGDWRRESGRFVLLKGFFLFKKLFGFSKEGAIRCII